jgi:hypothetical protein
MRWTLEDVATYEESKECVDTALIPIFSFEIDNISQVVLKEQKWLEEVCVYVERQLAGRVFLLPTLYHNSRDTSWKTIDSANFPVSLFVSANQEIFKALQENGQEVYLLERKENEEELKEMVREGKKLTDHIMKRWIAE